MYNIVPTPPHGEKIEGENGAASTVYQQYFTLMGRALSSVLWPLTYNTGAGRSTGSVLRAAEYTTDQINSMESPPNGLIVYDNVTNTFKFRENGSWVEK